MNNFYTVINQKKVCININKANDILDNLTVDDILLRWLNLFLYRAGRDANAGVIGGNLRECLPQYSCLLLTIRQKKSHKLLKALKQYDKDDMWKYDLVSNILRISKKMTNSSVIELFRNESSINGEPYVHKLFLSEVFTNSPNLLRLHSQELLLYERYHKSFV